MIGRWNRLDGISAQLRVLFWPLTSLTLRSLISSFVPSDRHLHGWWVAAGVAGPAAPLEGLHRPSGGVKVLERNGRSNRLKL